MEPHGSCVSSHKRFKPFSETETKPWPRPTTNTQQPTQPFAKSSKRWTPTKPKRSATHSTTRSRDCDPGRRPEIADAQQRVRGPIDLSRTLYACVSPGRDEEEPNCAKNPLDPLPTESPRTPRTESRHSSFGRDTRPPSRSLPHLRVNYPTFNPSQHGPTWGQYGLQSNMEKDCKKMLKTACCRLKPHGSCVLSPDTDFYHPKREQTDGPNQRTRHAASQNRLQANASRCCAGHLRGLPRIGTHG